MSFDTHSLFAYSTVATAPSPANSGTSLTVQAGDGLKFGVHQNLVVCPAGAQPTLANSEVVRLTAISTDTFTITRAQEGSTARSIVVGDQIFNSITPKALTDIESGGSLTAASLANATITATQIANATITATQIANGGIDYANLLSTIFSGQIQTQTNTGTAGGSMNYINLGGIKLLWGYTVMAIVTSTTNYTGSVTFPSSFFTTVPYPLAVSGGDGLTAGGGAYGAGGNNITSEWITKASSVTSTGFSLRQDAPISVGANGYVFSQYCVIGT